MVLDLNGHIIDRGLVSPNKSEAEIYIGAGAHVTIENGALHCGDTAIKSGPGHGQESIFRINGCPCQIRMNMLEFTIFDRDILTIFQLQNAAVL